MSRPCAISVVVPVFNRRDLLAASLRSILEAARAHGDVEVILVDHGSTDGAFEVALEYREAATVIRHHGGTIAAVRNAGAKLADAPLLSFIDADCVVPREYFRTLAEVFATTGAAASGCEVGIPADGHWTERVWHGLHAVPRDGFTHYLNSANFAVRRAMFETIGGFDEGLVTGEDTDICTRIRLAGGRIFESRRLEVVHLGNPKSVAAFYRKEVWRGLGGFAGTQRSRPSRTTMMVLAHVGAVAAAGLLLVVPTPLPLGLRLAAVPSAAVAAPAAAVVYRYVETGRVTSPVRSLALYTVYFFARAHALVKATAAALARPTPGVTSGVQR